MGGFAHDIRFGNGGLSRVISSMTPAADRTAFVAAAASRRYGAPTTWQLGREALGDTSEPLHGATGRRLRGSILEGWRKGVEKGHRQSFRALRGKSPAELLVGSAHPHWLEMLGYQRFQRN